jgi:hypothetical protein
MYIRGHLALAGIDSRASLKTYVDAAWAILVDAPYERLEKIQDKLIVAEAMANPEAARETWGLLPEHTRGAAGAEAMQPPEIPSGLPRR